MAKIAIFLCTICLLSHLAGFSWVAAAFIGRVVGGKEAAVAQFPHQISLRFNGSHGCGGSIISRLWVLTAAHCVVSYDDDGNYHTATLQQLSVRAGSNDRLTGGVLVGVSQIIVHENYGDFLNDVALLRMETPFIYSQHVQPVPLASVNTPGDVPVIISGWGRLKQDGDLPRQLQWSTLRALTLAECEKSIGWGVDSGLCLGHAEDMGACNGDSGGPALYRGELVGIAGFVVGGCGSSEPDGYARVYHFREWIKVHSEVA